MWHCHRIIDENDERTDAQSIADFINECEADGLLLAAASDGLLFFKDRPPMQVAPEPFEQEDVVYQAPPPPQPVHAAPSRTRGRRRPPRNATQPRHQVSPTPRRRQPNPDPSIRPSGHDYPGANVVQVDPRVMQGAPVAPQSAPSDSADPFGLG